MFLRGEKEKRDKNLLLADINTDVRLSDIAPRSISTAIGVNCAVLFFSTFRSVAAEI